MAPIDVKDAEEQINTGGMAMNKVQRTQRGFSLINGMISLGVVGILFGSVVPTVTAIVLDNRATTETQEIAKAFKLARSAAVTQRDTVIVSAVDGDWTAGIEIWMDHNGDQRLDAEELLYTVPKLATDAQLQERNGLTEFHFDRRGFVLPPTNKAIAFDYLAEGGCSWNHELKVTYTGRTKVKATECR